MSDDTGLETCCVLRCEEDATHVRNAAIPSKLCAEHAGPNDRPINVGMDE